MCVCRQAIAKEWAKGHILLDSLPKVPWFVLLRTLKLSVFPDSFFVNPLNNIKIQRGYYIILKNFLINNEEFATTLLKNRERFDKKEYKKNVSFKKEEK